MPQPCTRPLMLAAIMLMIAVAARAQSPQAATMRFVENRGQIVDAGKHQRPDILFSARSRAGTVYLRTSGLSYVFVRVDRDPLPTLDPLTTLRALPRPDTAMRETLYRMDVEFVGANTNARVERFEPGADYENFYLARCPTWITGVRGYARVVYRDIYPNIDLAYYSTDQGMKYDFIVRPGGRVSDIRLRYVGGTALAGTADGRVMISNPLGTVEEGRPVTYTGSGTAMRRQPVSARYHLADSTITFDVDSYDRHLPLVIDPTLIWSTYFGGSGYEATTGWGGWGGSGWGCGGCRSDRDTIVMMIGSTQSADFPTTPGVMQSTKPGAGFDYDAVVFCLNHRGARLWATYIGGNGADWAASSAIDSAHNYYVCGSTTSMNLPTTAGSFNQTRAGATPDGYLIKLDNAGHLIWCTYYVGAYVNSIAVDHAQNLILGGAATSAITTTPGAFQATPPPSNSPKGFLAKFTSSGARIWATYFGGTPPANPTEFDGVANVIVGANDSIYACGLTAYTDFPTMGSPFQATRRGPTDGWLAKLDSAGHPVWSTYLGGSSVDYVNDISLDSKQNLVVVGETSSNDFPATAGAFQPTLRSSNSGFVAKFDRNGRQIWATFLSGTYVDITLNVELDARDEIWTGSYALSNDFPVTADAYQLAWRGMAEVGIVQFDTAGHRLWGSYLGGTENDLLVGLAVTPFGVVVAGTTVSNNFPTEGTPFQNSIRGSYDMFVADFCFPAPVLDLNGHPARFCQGDSITLTAPVGFDTYRWSNGATTRSITVTTTGRYSVTTGLSAGSERCRSTSDTISVVVDPTPHRSVRPSTSVSICDGDSVIVRLDGPAATYRWSTGDSTATIKVKTAGRYSASFVDSNGCAGSTDTMTLVVIPRPTAVITASGPINICDGTSVTLDAGSGFASYAWNTGDTTQRLVVTRPGIYSVRVMNREGCWGPLSTSIKVKVYTAPTVAIRNVLPTTFCEGDSTVLAASPARFASYLWSTGATTPFIAVKKEGTYTLVVTDTNGCTATAQVTTSVTPSPHPRLTISGPTRFCRGDSVVLSANGFVQYQWSNGSSAPSIVVKDPGKYFVTVTGAGGCIGSSDTATVDVMPQPSVAISGPIRVCPNTLATYDAPSAPHRNYAWSLPGGGTITSGAGTSSITVQWNASGNGLLRLHVTNDSTGCSADTSITVVIGSSLVPAITANRSLRLCTGDSVMLDAGAYATYQWSTGATSRTITVGAAGKYTVSVADAKGCAGTSDPVEVTLNTPPQPAIAVPNGGTFCAGDSIVLDAGSDYAKYLWSNGFTSQRITLRATSRVSVTVTDTNGCTGTSSEVQVTSSPEIPPAVNGPVQVCQNSTVTYSTPATAGSTYQWVVTGGALLSGRGSANIRVGWGGVGTGRVDLVETTSLGCTGTSPGLDVTIGDHLVPAITPRGSIALCPGSTAHLDAGSGYASYQWSTGEKTQSIDVANAGSYAVTVADSSGCSGTSDTVNVFAKTAPVPAISGGPLEFCEGGSVTLTADAGYMSYLWSTGGTTPSVTVSTAGAYTVTVVDVDGCTGTSKAVSVIVDPLPAKPVITLAGDQLTSTPAVNYQWLLDGAAIAGATSQTLQATASGMYRVIVGNQFGCASVSDPVQYRIGTVARLVMLDTISARVGERAYLTMRVLPAFTAIDAVHAYHAELRYDPRALFIHDVVSPDRATTGEPALHLTDVTGLLTVDRPATSPVLIGDELFRVELEGLVTGQPLDVMTIERMAMPEVSSVSVAGSGLVILSGCEIGTAFAKVVRIETIRPNPARDEMIVRYRLPAGKVGELRLSDAAGREVARTTTPVGTGSFEELRVDLAHVSSGVYMIELRDGAERSAVPAVIAK